MSLPRFIPVPQAISPVGGTTCVFIEDVIRANIQELFSGTQVKGAHLFRIVRDTDLEIEEDEADDLLESIDRSLRQLRRGAISLLHVEAEHADARAQHPRRELRGQRRGRPANAGSSRASATGRSSRDFIVPS